MFNKLFCCFGRKIIKYIVYFTMPLDFVMLELAKYTFCCIFEITDTKKRLGGQSYRKILRAEIPK